MLLVYRIKSSILRWSNSQVIGANLSSRQGLLPNSSVCKEGFQISSSSYVFVPTIPCLFAKSSSRRPFPRKLSFFSVKIVLIAIRVLAFDSKAWVPTSHTFHFCFHVEWFKVFNHRFIQASFLAEFVKAIRPKHFHNAFQERQRCCDVPKTGSLVVAWFSDNIGRVNF